MAVDNVGLFKRPLVPCTSRCALFTATSVQSIERLSERVIWSDKLCPRCISVICFGCGRNILLTYPYVVYDGIKLPSEQSNSLIKDEIWNG